MVPKPDLELERELWPYYTRIAGMDEAGRGALAGPVAVGAVIFPQNPDLLGLLEGVRDSKLMTPLQRERWAVEIKLQAAAWEIGLASPEEIDTLGIVAATRMAAMRALAKLPWLPDYLLTDFRLEVPELDIPQTALVKGDQRSLSVAAASVLAKTNRDNIMRGLDVQCPGYRLSQNKGYATRVHRTAIKRLGKSLLHRKTFNLQ
ncbi:MAG: ribonuclease HII [Anaerolineales bacterium]|nr:ribonuclease HII [Anaerolineales bacterium]